MNIVKKLLKKNGRLILAVLALAVILTLAGCGGVYEAKPGVDFDDVTGDGGGGGSDPTVPGGGGLSASALLDTRFNGTVLAASGKHGMRIAPVSKAEVNKDEVTTNDTLGLWKKVDKDGNVDNKFHIEGMMTGTYANAGFDDVLILYYDDPFPEEFKISARIRITRVGGVSTGKGIHFGAYAPNREPIDGNQQFQTGQISKGMGLFFRAEAIPNFRLYYSDQNASTTAGTAPFHSGLNNLKIGKEYIYEVTRVKINAGQPWTSPNPAYKPSEPVGPDNLQTLHNGMYKYRILDSKSYEEVRRDPITGVMSFTAFPTLNLDATQHPIGNTVISMHPTLKDAVFAGICISGSAAEISQIKVWNKGNVTWDYANNKVVISDTGVITVTGPQADVPIFATPETIPAYVPAQFICSPTLAEASADFKHPDVTPTVNQNDRQPNPDRITTYKWNGGAYYTQLSGPVYNCRITMKPAVSPSYAEDTIHFEFFKLADDTVTVTNPAGAFTTSLGGTTYTQAGVAAVTGDYGIITVDPNALVSGVKATADFKLVARDIGLDTDMTSPNYSQMQTLPEYYFRVEVTKP